MYKQIGVVGQGFVGTAVKKGFEDTVNVYTYDKYKPSHSSCITLSELCNKAQIIFVCVPTPMNLDGSCNIDVVTEVVLELDNLCSKDHVLVLKSTVPPGTTDYLNNLTKNVTVVFNPEFLTEANFLEDFKNQDRIIIGGPRPASSKVKNLFRKRFPATPIIKTGTKTAEMVKYFCNCLLATKVSFSNEMKQLCDTQDIDYDKVVEYSLYDSRIGKTHLSSPGPDGKLGFGGSCFPKDINAMIRYMENNGIVPLVLNSVWEKNLEVRPEKDWENLVGRAVISNYNLGDKK